MRHLLIYLIVCTAFLTHAQVNINTLGVGGTYSENFSGIVTTGFGADNTANTWVDNTTLPGWYLSNETTPSFIYNSILTTADNVGRNYMFELSGDKSVGFRASGTSPNDNLYVGLRLLNNTGSAAASFYLTYYGEQWSIAENASPAGTYHINNLAFSYQQGSTVTSLLTGTYNSVVGLNFIQLHSCTLAVCTGTSAQRVILNGNLASNRTLVSGCVDVAIPAGQEIMLRWHDVDNVANDHHLQIDDITVALYDVACLTVLPVTLLSFNATRKGSDALIEWETAEENGIAAYVLEHSTDGFAFNEVGEMKPYNKLSTEKYEVLHTGINRDHNYYRLKIIDQNGKVDYSAVKVVTGENQEDSPLMYQDNGGMLIIQQKNLEYNEAVLYDIQGRQIQAFPLGQKNEKISLAELSANIYCLQLKGKYASFSQKIFLR